MSYVADLHTHSRFAIGTSRSLDFDALVRGAKTKGIDLLATADFTHPVWLEETRAALSETPDGMLELDGVSFVLGTEVNCTAQQGGRSRRVHILLFAPDFAAVDALNARLASSGSLDGDGRPTLRLSPHDLLATALDVDERCFAIPAHLWTPWFGLYGARSGFDSLQECFGDLAERVHAVESGLSADPAMCWRVPSLDGVSIVSFSDAHSPGRLGRELTVFRGEPSYDGLREALASQQIEYTVELFPEEGKYHHSGHRKCGVRLSPAEAIRTGARCPECGRPMTKGVLQRVEELSARPAEAELGCAGLIRGRNGRPPFRRMVSLGQIVSEALECGPATKRVATACTALVSYFGNELAVLLDAPEEDIAAQAGERTAQGISRVRGGDLEIEPGYDGMYGSVNIWPGG